MTTHASRGPGRPQGPDKVQKTIKLTPEAVELGERLMKERGLNFSELLEQLIREADETQVTPPAHHRS